MTAKKRILIICIGVGLSALFVALLLVIGIGSAPATPVTVMGYEDRIFKTDRIHRIEIYMDNWEGFLETCTDEKYASCTVVINGEQLDNVGLRATGDSSLTAVAEMDSSRYSYQLEFDHYDSDQTYHRLDKLNLNNLFQDNTMMKENLTYELMRQVGVAAPLSSYTTVYVNDRSFGLYLAVEAIEESFLERYYGSDYGELYKPHGDNGQDVKLQYIDDNPESYPNIFDNAITDVTPEDQARLIGSLKQLSTGKKLKNALDIEAVIRYFAVHNFVCNEDSYTGSTVHNYYLYEKDGKLTMLPRDYHLAFDGIPTGDASAVVNQSIYSPVANGDLSSRPMLSWILNSGKYTWLYKRHYIELLTVDVKKMVETTYNMIAPYVERDPSRFCTYEEFEAGVEALKEFLELRSESVWQQLWKKNVNVDEAASGR